MEKYVGGQDKMQRMIFLLMRTDRGSWSVVESDKLEDLRLAWVKVAEQNPYTSGVVHVGETCPEPGLFENIARREPGRVLATEPALRVLRGQSRIGHVVVDRVADLALYRVMTWWTYRIVEDTPVRSSTARAAGWIAAFCDSYVADAPALEAVGLRTPEAYETYESLLAVDVRQRLARYRVDLLLQENHDDPCDLAAASPGWFARRALADIPMTVRLHNVFHREGIGTVRDLGALDTNQMLEFGNFGHTSLADLKEALRSALQQGPILDEEPCTPSEDDITPDVMIMQAIAGVIPTPQPDVLPQTFLEELDKQLATLDPRDRSIVEGRLGYRGETQTPAELGAEHGITRERVRQIQDKGIRYLHGMHGVFELFRHKVAAALTNSDKPMRSDALDRHDAWFAGMETRPVLLAEVLKHFGGGRFHIIEIECGATIRVRIARQSG